MFKTKHVFVTKEKRGFCDNIRNSKRKRYLKSLTKMCVL
jgi:hypothetical protein